MTDRIPFTYARARPCTSAAYSETDYIKRKNKNLPLDLFICFRGHSEALISLHRHTYLHEARKSLFGPLFSLRQFFREFMLFKPHEWLHLFMALPWEQFTWTDHVRVYLTQSPVSAYKLRSNSTKSSLREQISCSPRARKRNAMPVERATLQRTATRGESPLDQQFASTILDDYNAARIFMQTFAISWLHGIHTSSTSNTLDNGTCRPQDGHCRRR